MIRVRKKQNIMIRACRLGDGSPLEKQLIESGKMRRINDVYEIFSQEALNGRGECGRPGDYVKVDTTGSPYPNDGAFFEKKHVHVAGEYYRQIPEPLDAWRTSDGPCDVIGYLLDTGRLVIDASDPQRYFRAFLWGAPLSAARDAVVVFYAVRRNDRGEITDVDFNFVERAEFERTYEILCEE